MRVNRKTATVPVALAVAVIYDHQNRRDEGAMTGSPWEFNARAASVGHCLLVALALRGATFQLGREGCKARPPTIMSGRSMSWTAC
jgi:hypothetical protein